MSGQAISHGMDVPAGTEVPEGFELGDGVRRDSRCVAEWSACSDGEYNPHCCRWPKSCSATSVPNRVYAAGILEPASEPVPKLTIVEFLEARLAYDEQVCAATPGGAFKVVPLDGSTEADAEAVHQYYHRFQPEWVARDLDAKRKIVRNAKVQLAAADTRPDDDPDADRIDGAATINESVLEYLALPYADHPDYQEEWRP